MCVWVYSRGRPISYPAWWIQLFCGWISFGCLAVFPRHKGRKTASLFFLFVYWATLVINRFDSTNIPELGDWLELFVVLTHWSFFCRSRKTADQARFSTFYDELNNQKRKTSSKVQLENVIDPKGNLPPHRRLFVSLVYKTKIPTDP